MTGQQTLLASTVAALWSPPPNSLVQQHAVEAFNSFNTQFPEEISIANFGMEFTEIGSLVPRIQSNLLKTGANGWLSYEFGIKPLVGDLETLLNLSASVKARLEYLRSRYKKPTKLGYHAKDFWKPSSSVVNVQYTSYMRHVFTLKSYSTEYRAGGRLFHTLEYLDETLGRVIAYLGALGLNNPLKVIWNRIPYSFVVDWVVDISSLLSYVGTLQDVSGNWKLSRLHSSVKTSAKIEVQQVNLPSSLATPMSPITLGTVDVVTYQRWLGLPVTSEFLAGLTSPNSRQVALLGAIGSGKT
jgi:hypothetical protein